MCVRVCACVCVCVCVRVRVRVCVCVCEGDDHLCAGGTEQLLAEVCKVFAGSGKCDS